MGEVKKMKFISGEELVENWKAKHFPPVERDAEWERFKVRVCKRGDALNPILQASGGEIQCEQFGIIGWLNIAKMHKDCDSFKDVTGERISNFMQCSLVEARETGTGRFGEWIESVKKYCKEEHHIPFAFHNITNQGLYKYAERHGVWVSDENGMLFTVKTKE
jgi:hypothetical protein